MSGCWGVTNYLFDLRHFQTVVVRYAFDPFSCVEATNDYFGHHPGSVNDRPARGDRWIYDDNSRRIAVEIPWPVHPDWEELNGPAFFVALYSAKIKIEYRAKAKLSPTRYINRLFFSRPLNLFDEQILTICQKTLTEQRMGRWISFSHVINGPSNCGHIYQMLLAGGE